MKLNILQLNMWAGTRFPAIKEFLSKNKFDILCFQEVAGPRSHGNVNTTMDSFQELRHILGDGYKAQLVKSNTYAPTPDISYEGNAIFYRKEFRELSHDVLWLYKRETPFPQNLTSFEGVGRTALHIRLVVENKEVSIVTAHLPWAKTPLEQPHQRKLNLKFIEYISKLEIPWILTGDFNIQPDQQSILDLEQYGTNLTKKYNAASTIDPTLHKAWDQIKPGFPVDYIFVSPDIQVDSFEVLNTVHISDHFGLTAILEI